MDGGPGKEGTTTNTPSSFIHLPLKLLVLSFTNAKRENVTKNEWTAKEEQQRMNRIR